ncbi:MAG: ribonuclease R [Gammaproteobacteria bacterium]|nr:ribonuclease R [Gammaproteobacteria bacterium]
MSTRKPKKTFRDPMAEREQQKYEHPVPSREAILALLTERNEPLPFRELADALGVHGERDEDAFSRRLRAMERDGQILKNRRGLFGLAHKMDMVSGRVSGHPDGFGFLIPDEEGEDLFLSPAEMRQVMHGDRVMARVTGVDQRGRREGAVVEVLERAHLTVVGRYVTPNGAGFVVPENKRITQDIVISRGDENFARENQIVVAEITSPPTRHRAPAGRVVEVLGDHMAPGMEIEVAIRAHDIPHVWPQEVRDEVDGLAPQVPPQVSEGRFDLRGIPLVTIDGEDARDFDDAVFAEHDGRQWRLIVAIADVSYYVKPGTALDREAYQRGNSVYFPQHVIPMLPEVLSNGLCSINPKVDRLCMACEMQIDAHGNISRYRFLEAAMRSRARLTYTKVASMLVEKDAALRREYEDVVPHLEALYGLYKILHTARMKRGAVDFELPETRIVFDEQRKIQRIEPLQRNDAHRLIEECMLAANVCAAEILKKHKVPAPYRIHEGPTAEKLNDLREFLSEIGLSLGGGDKPQAQHYSKLIKQVEKRPDSRLIQTVLLRSLSQAVYSPDNIGHFALGYPNYTHFTSPIRRYPDLLVHRAIKNILVKRPAEITPELAMQQGEHCSTTERRADEATREVTRWLKAEFMMDKIGEEFDGYISGVTNFGIFVELVQVYVDGLVHITALGNDYYHFDAAHHRLMGERTRQVYRLGDKVRVRVVRVDLDETKIDFELVGVSGAKTGKAPKQRRPEGKRQAKPSGKRSRKRRRGHG